MAHEEIIELYRHGQEANLADPLRKGQLLEEENRVLRGEGHPDLVAESPAMKPVTELVARVGPSDANVLITGENGSGKGVVASALHALSERASRPLVTVNVGGLSEGAFESELSPDPHNHASTTLVVLPMEQFGSTQRSWGGRGD